MRNISDTIARLAALRARQAADPTTARGDPLSELTEFGSNPGALKGWLHVPEKLLENPPLVVILHGCTQTAATYASSSGWSQLADRQGFVVLYPEQQRTNNANLCFNWFVPSDTRRDTGEVASIAQMIETAIALHGIDRKLVFVTGLSAGGAMASAMLATHPDVFAGGAIIAGLPHGVASGIPDAFDRMRGHGLPSDVGLQALLRDASDHDGPWPTISVWHGTADATVAFSNAQAVIGQWRAVHKLDGLAAKSEVVDGFPRQTWRDGSGRLLVESYSITGMGHGTPLSTAGKNGVGRAAPFMLDVGISSTVRIAQFWGIADRLADAAKAPLDKPKPDSRAVAKPAAAADEKMRMLWVEPQRQRPRQPAADAKSTDSASSGVGKIIADALKAAGLMR